MAVFLYRESTDTPCGLHIRARSMGASVSPQLAEDSLNTLVLCSGGLDSVTLLYELRRKGACCTCLFIDYGHPAAPQEWGAVQQVSATVGVPLRRIAIGGVGTGLGEIPGRNAALVACATMADVPVPGAIALGIHSGTRYPDCSEVFLHTMQGVLDLYFDGQVSLLAPYLTLDKLDVFQRAQELGVPVHMTFSCEKPTPLPCGECVSCFDRNKLRC